MIKTCCDPKPVHPGFASKLSYYAPELSCCASPRLSCLLLSPSPVFLGSPAMLFLGPSPAPLVPFTLLLTSLSCASGLFSRAPSLLLCFCALMLASRPFCYTPAVLFLAPSAALLTPFALLLASRPVLLGFPATLLGSSCCPSGLFCSASGLS